MHSIGVKIQTLLTKIINLSYVAKSEKGNEKLQALRKELSDVIYDSCLEIDSLQGKIAVVEDELEKVNKQRTALVAEFNDMKNSIISAMRALDVKKITGDNAFITLIELDPIYKYDKDKIEEKYKLPGDFKIAKEDMKKDLENGANVKGIEKVRNFTIDRKYESI